MSQNLRGKVNRRSFLTSAAGAGAALALPTILPASVFGAGAPSNRIVMGAIGIGGMGRGNLQNFLGQPGVQFVAVTDVYKPHRNRAKAAIDKRNGNTDCKAYNDYREMLANHKLDAVSQATPDHWHALTSIACAQAGCDVYGEKPFTHTLREGRALCDTLHRYGRIWQTGSWQRSGGHFRHACELVRNGRIGKVTRVDVGLPRGGGGGKMAPANVPAGLDWDFYVGPAPYTPFTGQNWNWNWRWFLDFGGGQLMDWVGHHADIAHWGLGLDRTGPVKVEPVNVAYPTDGLWDAPMTYKCRCTYAGGLELILANSRQVRGGATWFGQGGKWIHVNRGRLQASDPKILKERIGPGETRLYHSGDHHANFLDCVRTRRETVAPAETAHRSASIGHLCMIALATGRTIRFDPKTEQILGDDRANALLGNAYRAPWSL